MKKNWILYLTFLLGGLFTTEATASGITNGYQNGITFTESGITFNILKNGEFDFFLDAYADETSTYYQGNGVSISYNSGFDYAPFIQRDRFNAIIQIEDTPIYYDNYGRVSQIGTVEINYRNRYINRVGGLYIYYNANGYYSHYTGYINYYNPRYVYRPCYTFFIAPRVNYCNVRPRPYRRNYRPNRAVYHGRRTYTAPRNSYAANPRSTSSRPRSGTTRPRTVASTPRNVSPKPRTSSTRPRTVASTPRNVSPKPRTSSTRPRSLASTPRNVSPKPRTSSTRPRSLASTPRNVSPKPRTSSTRPRSLASTPRSIKNSSKNRNSNRNRVRTSRSTRNNRR